MVDNHSASYESHIVMETRKRRVLSISEKMELIRLTENSPKNKKAIAAKFKIPVHTLNTIYASREKIFEKCKGNFANMNLKRLRPSTYPDIEESLFNWYTKNHSNGHISCLSLREKALQLAKTFGHENFSASYGWIERFKFRHNLKFRKSEDKTATSSTEISETINDTILNEHKDDISESENSFYETGISDHQKLDKNLLKESTHNTITQIVEVEQEYDKDFDSGSHCSIVQNGAEEESESCPSPSHILPQVNLTELYSSNLNSLVNYSKAANNKTIGKFSIHDVENAFNVVCNYIENSDENVNEKTINALSTLKSFIIEEKNRKAQSKITDYFNIKKCKK